MKNILFILLVLIFLPLKASAANKLFKQLTINEGLAHTDANCITQDSTGLIWIGTNAGLQSYDGYSLQTFDYYSSGQKIFRSHNRINDMACSKDKLWMGTESGLTCFDLNTHRYIPYYIEGNDKEQPFDAPVYNLELDPTGQYLWLTTAQGIAVMKTNNEKLQPLDWDSETERVLCKNINSLLFQGETIWASNKKSIMQLSIRDDKVSLQKKYPSEELFQKNREISEIYLFDNFLYIRVSGGCYRISTTGNKLNRPTLAYIDFHRLDPEIPAYTKGKFIVTREGSLWCAYTEGVFEVKNPFSERPTAYKYLQNSRNSSLSAMRIKDMLIDRYDNLWIATSSWGVFYRALSNSFFKNISRTDFQGMGFLQNEIVSVTGQPDGTLWMIVEYASLFRYDPQTEQLSLIPLPKEDSRGIYYQKILTSRNQRYLYLGTNFGIFIYDTQTDKLTKLQPDKVADAQQINTSIADLAEDAFGRLWVATWGNGVTCIDHPLTAPTAVMHLNTQTDPGLLSRHISSILTKGKYIYLCTTNGLNRILLADDGSLKTLSSYQVNESSAASMSTNYLASADCANDTVCWIGTIGGGLNKLVLHSEKANDYTATCYTTQDGLPSNDCEIVLLDQFGNVWIGGNGIVQLDTRKNKIDSYGFANGLQNHAFKVNVSHKGYDGTLYMGGLYGLSFFSPGQPVTNAGYHGLMFSDLSVNNRQIVPQADYNGRVVLNQILDKTSQLTLNHQQNNFTVSFAASGYNLSGQIMYRYRLKGFLNEWQTLHYTNNEIYFSNLPYDSYELEVQLSTDKGYTWHEPGRKLAITVLPPWWLSGWAKLAYGALIISIIVMAFRQYNKEQNLKRENEIQKILIAKDEEKYQAKMQFFMNASHELKTPLTLILLAAEKLMGNSHPSKEHQTILHNARKTLTLIAELVDIRKQDLGIASLNLSHIDMTRITRQLFDETSSWAENKQITISYAADKDAIEMDADKNKIGKMIVNLFSNAIKYTNKGGRIDITLKRGTLNDIKPHYAATHVEGSIPAGQPICILTVKDTGVGISSDSIRLIYERFFQVKGETQTHLGTGIGLAIVKSTVLQHKGMIVVSSERNSGSEFIVALPIRHELSEPEPANIGIQDAGSFIKEQYNEFQLDETQEKVSTEPVAENPDLPTLLIVEDNKELQTALKEHLSSSYNVLTADNGRIGLETCMSTFPDIIVSDVMMPEMNGIEMCRQIKNNLSVAYIPLVMLTAKDNLESQIEGYESGADLYIPKPFSMKLLEVNLQRLLKQREQWFKGNPATEDAEPTAVAATAAEEEGTAKTTAISEEQQKMTDKLKSIIAEHISDPDLSPDQLSRALGISRSKLYKDLNGVDGQSLSDYVRNFRLEKAAQLLLISGMNVQEVMNEVGFVNSSHFTKVFKLKFDMTPTEYKRKQLGSNKT